MGRLAAGLMSLSCTVLGKVRVLSEVLWGKSKCIGNGRTGRIRVYAL